MALDYNDEKINLGFLDYCKILLQSDNVILFN
jgi:hypothetical protein